MSADPSGDGHRATVRDAAFAAVDAVAAHLVDQGDRAWTGWCRDPVTLEMHRRELDVDLYEGLAGLVVAFGAAAEAGHGDADRWRSEAATRLAAAVGGGALLGFDVGLVGIGGVLWAAHRCWLDTGSDAAASVVSRAGAVLVAAVRRRKTAGALDLVGGEAGALAVLADVLAQGSVAGDLLADTATHLVDLLLAAAEPAPVGVVWPLWDAREHIVGLGHGTSGIALALHRAAAVLDHRRDEVVAAVAGAVAYEDATLDREAGNWRDARLGHDAVPMNAFCYGAAGVRRARHELGVAVPAGVVAATAAEHDREVITDTLCCGAAGRLVVASATGSHDAPAAADALARRVLDGAVELTLDGRAAAEAPGLFTGLPGVALALLHHLEPAATPDPLVLR